MRVPSFSNQVISKIVIFILGIGFVQLAAADTLYTLKFPQQDVSLTYLNFIFGPLSGQGSYLFTTSFSYLVVKLLALSVAVASYMATYILFKASFSTSQEGVFMGSQWSSFSVIIRGTAGMGLLVPDINGYALVQKMFMSFIVSGIGLANSLYGVIITNYIKGNSLIANSTYSTEDTSVAQILLQTAIVLNYLNITDNLQSYSLIPGTYAQCPCISLQVTNPSNTSSNIPLLKYTVKNGVIPPELILTLNNMLDYYYSDSLVVYIANTIKNYTLYNRDATSLGSGGNVIGILSNQTVQTDELNNWASTQYSMAHSYLLKEDTQKHNSIEPYLEQGWLNAGMIYWKLSFGGAQSSYSSVLQLSEGLNFSTLMNALNSVQFTTTSTAQIAVNDVTTQIGGLNPNTANQGSISNDSKYVSQIGIINFEFQSLNGVYSKIMNGQDPIIGFIQDCQGMLKGVIIFFMSTIVTMILISFLAFLRWINPAVHLVFYLIASVLLVLVSFSVIFIPPVIFGGYFLPLIPFLVYASAGFSWLMTTVEAIVAAPIVAVALMEPSQDDFGKAEATTTLLLSVVLKPSLMVLGFAIAMRLVMIGLIVFSYSLTGFMGYKGFIFSASDNLIDKLLSYIILNEAIVYAIVALVSRSFSLIYMLPDRVFSWIGSQADSISAQEIVDQTQSGALEGIKMIKEIFKLSSSAAKVGLQAYKFMADQKSK